jgi:hypothetical protein
VLHVQCDCINQPMNKLLASHQVVFLLEWNTLKSLGVFMHASYIYCYVARSERTAQSSLCEEQTSGAVPGPFRRKC